MSIKKALKIFGKSMFVSNNETDYLKLKINQYYIKISDLHVEIDKLYELSEGKQTEEIIRKKDMIQELQLKIKNFRNKLISIQSYNLDNNVIKKALKLFEKFAAIPEYNKCKKCGNADPYLSDDGLCFKCFDQNRPQLRDKEEKSKSGTRMAPISILDSLTRTPDGRLYNVNKIGNFIVSIQGGPGSYSDPQERLNDPGDYDEFEVAFWEDTPVREMIKPLEDPRFYKKYWAKHWGSEKVVGAWVPRKAIEEMLADLSSI